MSKIKIKSYIKSKENTHIFEGEGILKDNQIIYFDNKTRTKINLGNIISIERTNDYYIKINLKESIKLEGIYKTKYGSVKMHATAHKIKKEKNKLEIKYGLFIDEHYVDTFEYILKLTIDS